MFLKVNTKNLKNKKLHTQKGVTLVALVISIIILLLVSTISIHIMKNVEIINKTKDATKIYEFENLKEQLYLTIRNRRK